MNGQTSFLEITGWALLHSLWQMALLWLVFQLITSLFPGTKSGARASLASGLLLAGFGWFICTLVWLMVDSASGAAVVLRFSDNDYSGSLLASLEKVLPVISIVYFFLLFIPLSRFIRNYRYVTVIRKYGLAKPEAQWRVFVKQAAAHIGIKRTVNVWLSDFVSSPVTIGFLKPMILLPLASVNSLTPAQLEAVLLHELAHIRRHDYFINLLVTIVKTLLYFNPFVKLLAKQLEKEREKGCDELVLQFQYDSYEYATALLALEKSAHEYKAMILAASGNSYDLLQRVELIMGVRKKKIFSPVRLLTIMGSICLVVMMGLFGSFSRQSNSAQASLFPLKNNLPQPYQYAAQSKHSGPVQFFDTRSRSNDVTGKDGETNAVLETVAPDMTDNPEMLNAASRMSTDIPELKAYQEEQVKKALEESRKVLKNIEWKEVERSIAEVFTEKEKKELKAVYQKQIDKYDWSNLEHNLRAAYDKVDWDNVNRQLAYAINNIRVDSLQHVYNEALCKLNDSKKQISENLKVLIDSNINARILDEKRVELRRSLDRLKSLRNKKTIHL